jgi:hypothetical protein
MNKSTTFKKAHQLAKSVHVAGDCYRVTFGAALKIVIAESKAPLNLGLEKFRGVVEKAIQKDVLSFWSKNSLKRAYVKNSFLFDAALRECGIACNSAYFDLTSLELKFDSLRAYENKNGVKFAGCEKELLKTAKSITTKFLSEQMRVTK